MIIGTLVASIAPISWFVLMKSHTYIHHEYCPVTFYIPFAVMAMTLLIEAILVIIGVVLARKRRISEEKK